MLRRGRGKKGTEEREKNTRVDRGEYSKERKEAKQIGAVPSEVELEESNGSPGNMFDESKWDGSL